KRVLRPVYLSARSALSLHHRGRDTDNEYLYWNQQREPTALFTKSQPSYRDHRAEWSRKINRDDECLYPPDSRGTRCFIQRPPRPCCGKDPPLYPPAPDERRDLFRPLRQRDSRLNPEIQKSS